MPHHPTKPHDEQPNVLDQINATWQAFKNSTGCSQAEAAKQLGMNQSAFSQYLRGAVPLNTDFKRKFAELTGSKVGDETAFNGLSANLKRPDRPGEQVSVHINGYDHLAIPLASPNGLLAVADPNKKATMRTWAVAVQACDGEWVAGILKGSKQRPMLRQTNGTLAPVVPPVLRLVALLPDPEKKP